MHNIFSSLATKNVCYAQVAQVDFLRFHTQGLSGSLVVFYLPHCWQKLQSTCASMLLLGHLQVTFIKPASTCTVATRICCLCCSKRKIYINNTTWVWWLYCCLPSKATTWVYCWLQLVGFCLQCWLLFICPGNSWFILFLENCHIPCSFYCIFFFVLFPFTCLQQLWCCYCCIIFIGAPITIIMIVDNNNFYFVLNFFHLLILI